MTDALVPPTKGPEMQPITSVAPHAWKPRGWHRWICQHCYGPKSLHPRREWVRSRPRGDNTYLAPSAPHFTDGW